MNQEPYPKEVKKTDLPWLVEKAKKAKRKGNWALLGLGIFYGLIAYLSRLIFLN